MAATPEGAPAITCSALSQAQQPDLSTAGARVMVGSVYFLTIILLAVKMFHSETHIGRSWQHGDGRLGWFMILGLVVNFGLWLNVAISDPGFLPAGQVGVANPILLGSRLLTDRQYSEQHKQPFLLWCSNPCASFLVASIRAKDSEQLGAAQGGGRASPLTLHDVLGIVAASNQQGVPRWDAAASPVALTTSCPLRSW